MRVAKKHNFGVLTVVQQTASNISVELAERS